MGPGSSGRTGSVVAGHGPNDGLASMQAGCEGGCLPRTRQGAFMPSRTTKARLLGLALGAAALPGLVLVTASHATATPGSTSGARPTPVPAALATVDKAGSLAPSLRDATGTVA